MLDSRRFVSDRIAIRKDKPLILMKVPRVSIGLPVWNGEKYIRSAVDSILRQDYADFELIISDNASTDATQDICREFAAKDPRIRYYRNEKNIGASANFNRLVELARGELFKWATHDDIHLPGFVGRCVEIIDQAPATVALVTPKAEVIDEHGNVLDLTMESLDARQPRAHQRARHVFRSVRWATAQFGLIRTNVLKRTRLIQPYYATDWVLLVEIALMGEIWEFPEILFRRRFHPGASTNLHKNWRDLQAWFNPSQTGLKRFAPPPVRLDLEMAEAVIRARLPLSERFLCGWAFLSVWLPRQGMGLGVKSKLKKLFNGRPEECCQLQGR